MGSEPVIRKLIVELACYPNGAVYPKKMYFVGKPEFIKPKKKKEKSSLVTDWEDKEMAETVTL